MKIFENMQNPEGETQGRPFLEAYRVAGHSGLFQKERRGEFRFPKIGMGV